MCSDAEAAADVPRLPGEEIVTAGVADIESRRRSAASALVDIARTRLTQAGVIRADAPQPITEPELSLYRILAEEGGDAYSRYNALLRELDSFAAALERRNGQARRNRTL